MIDTADTQPALDVVLYPNRSLDGRGYVVVMTLIAIVSGCMGVTFAVIGAWPVVGFVGLDALLVVIAFRSCAQKARCAEFIRLDATGLHVRRIDPNGSTRAWLFEPHWVRVSMDDPPRHGSSLVLSSHGRHLTLAGFLTPDERLDFARALRQALERQCRPARCSFEASL